MQLESDVNKPCAPPTESARTQFLMQFSKKMHLSHKDFLKEYKHEFDDTQPETWDYFLRKSSLALSLKGHDSQIKNRLRQKLDAHKENNSEKGRSEVALKKIWRLLRVLF